MANGVDFRTVLKCGFLNHDPDLLLAQYRSIFDIVFVDDPTLLWLKTVLQQLTHTPKPKQPHEEEFVLVGKWRGKKRQFKSTPS
jgi:hypothetical protein